RFIHAVLDRLVSVLRPRPPATDGSDDGSGHTPAGSDSGDDDSSEGDSGQDGAGENGVGSGP
ncbi:MAG: hypothetical protein KDG54_17105, partial [Geminicoccaceae bacterium]|nr:hypothetical protein [Geminicoccaceae bacterium]